MQGLLHHAQNLSILRAIDPDDARGVEAKAGQGWRIAIGKACRPKQKSILAAQNLSRDKCRKSCHGGRQLALKPASAKFMERAELQALSRQRSIQPMAGQRQNARVSGRLQTMAFKSTDLKPEGFEFRIHTHNTF